jgi:uncharacterized membrane protein
MGLVGWSIAIGAVLGWFAGDYSGSGFVFGGLLGAGMGWRLRALIRRDVEAAVRVALADAAFSGQPMQPPRPVTHAAAVVDVWPRDNPAPFDADPAPFDADPAPLDADPAPLDAMGSLAAGPSQTTTQSPHAVAPPRAGPAPVVQDRDVFHGPADDPLAKMRDWLLGGNTIARVGLATLFIGLVFLARLAASAGLFPIEVRLTLVAAAGVVLLLVGFRKRIERPPFALALQGAGVAVLYLVVFAADRAFGVMPPLAAFAFMVLFAALGCALALLQNAQAMALASFLGGFAVPALLGGTSETPLGLFVYLTILNLAILAIAWKKSWRPLNLLGFVATLLLASTWGSAFYEDRHFLMCEIFLVLSVAIYLATVVLYAHNTPGKLGHYVDSTVLFGSALAGFGFQAGLVRGLPFAETSSALGFGAVYLGVAALNRRGDRPGMRLLNECLLALGVGFVSLAVPLALETTWAASTWALEGAGAFWVGARQARWMPRAFGLALQALAAVLVPLSLGANVATLPLANNGFLVPMMAAAPALFVAWLMRVPLDHSGSSLARGYAPLEHGLRHVWFLGGFALVCLAILCETGRFLPAPSPQAGAYPALALFMQGYVSTLAILAAMALAQTFGRRRDWPVATWPARLALPLLANAFLMALGDGRYVVFLPDAFFWVVAIGLHLWLLRRWSHGRWTVATHVGGVLLGTLLVADGLWLGVERGALWDTSWAGGVFLLGAVAVLVALTRWAGKAAQRGDTEGLPWPLHPEARAYWWHAALVLAVLVYCGALATTLTAEGVTDPLPYIPGLNPVDLSALLALAALALWRRMLAASRPQPRGARWLCGKEGLAAGAALAFAIANMAWLRTAHHVLGVGWSGGQLAQSQIVQSGLSLLWTLIAMGLMFFAHRRVKRLPWLTGAVLLGVVVAKLMLVDTSQVEGVARIVAFIGVGVLMVLIGYFVPLPPREEGRAERGA